MPKVVAPLRQKAFSALPVAARDAIAAQHVGNASSLVPPSDSRRASARGVVDSRGSGGIAKHERAGWAVIDEEPAGDHTPKAQGRPKGRKNESGLLPAFQLRAAAARAAAAREGLALVPAANICGFKGVTRNRSRRGGKFQAHVREAGKTAKARRLGLFATAEEAALAYARHVGQERAAREAAAEARVERPQPLTAEQARASAVREGVELVPANNESGFRGVQHTHGKFNARVREGGRQRHLGYFDTAEEAALAYARRIGKERAASEAAAAGAEEEAWICSLLI